MRRRKVLFYTKSGEEILFDSVRQAAKQMKMCNNTIYKRIDDRGNVFRNGKCYRIRFVVEKGGNSTEIRWYPYPAVQPPEVEIYLVTYKSEGRNRIAMLAYNDGTVMLNGSLRYGFASIDSQITAWAELPDPYEAN